MGAAAWAYLARVVEGPHRELNALLGEVGPEEAAERIRARRGLPPGLARATEARHGEDRAAADLESAAAAGFRLVTPEDPEWPVAAVQAFVRGGARAPAPHALWVHGAPLAGLLGEAVGVVGTRAASGYGLRLAREISAGLAGAGVTVLSGGALGVDAEAHRAALEAGGRTMVIAAAGPGVTYPPAHHRLFREVARSGAVVTEYPPGTRPARHRFLTRNRLIAGLGEALVLVEAGWRSGARNTVHWAGRLGRPVGAVPGPVGAAGATGCHAAIREGEATLVTGARDVLGLLRPVGAVDEDAQLELDWAPDPVQALPREELRIYDATPPRGPGARAREIAAEAGVPPGLTVHLLGSLEAKALVRRDGARWRRRDGAATAGGGGAGKKISRD